MPIGYLVAVVPAALCTLLAVAPPRPRQSGSSNLAFRLGFLVSEQPYLVFGWLLAATALVAVDDDVGTAVGRTAAGLAALTTVGLAVLVRRGLRSAAAVDAAMRNGLGNRWRSEIDAPLATGLRRRRPWWRILFGPWLVGRRDVERVPNLSYGEAGERHLLDVYRHRSRPEGGGPMLVYFHGGGFRGGRKSRESRPLLYRLASQGWVCISANYRLSPPARFPDFHVDAKAVIAWARRHGHDYGGDPNTLFVAGSSAGAHLATMVALTPGDPRFQPGFEDVDTSVSAAITLYGYYGGLGADDDPPSAPAAYLTANAPPFFAAHGGLDTIVLVEHARRFCDELRRTSSNPVVYVELPGAQHTFDLFHSIRFDTVVDAIEAFAAWVRSSDRSPRR